MEIPLPYRNTIFTINMWRRSMGVVYQSERKHKKGDVRDFAGIIFFCVVEDYALEMATKFNTLFRSRDTQESKCVRF